MNRDDFFKEIESKMSAIDDKEAADAKKKAQREGEVAAILQQARLVLDEYEKQLQARGVTVDYKCDQISLKFVLCYSDGYRYGFSMGKKSRNINGKIWETYNTEMIPGQARLDQTEELWMPSLPRLTQDWSKPEFEEFVQYVISKFFEASDKHGGYKGAPNSGWDS